MKDFGTLHEYTIQELSWVVAMVTGHSQHCYIAVACPITMATDTTIVIVGY